MKMLVVGWDGASHEWLEQHPNICKFYEMMPVRDRLLPDDEYVGGYIDSGNAWTTITTGVSPKEHGIEDFYHIWKSDGTIAKQKPVSNEFVRFERLWDYMLSTKSFIFNIPVTWPVKPINGTIMAGGPNPGKDIWYPPEFGNKYKCPKFRPPGSSFNDWFWNDDLRMERIKFCQEKRQEVVKDILIKTQPEFAFIHMHLLDTWCHRPGKHLEIPYKMLDLATAELYSIMKPDKILLLSDHGMCPATKEDKEGSPWLVLNHDSTNGMYAGNIQLDMNLQKRITPNILAEMGIIDDPSDFKPQKKTLPTKTRKETLTKEQQQQEQKEIISRLQALGYFE